MGFTLGEIAGASILETAAENASAPNPYTRYNVVTSAAAYLLGVRKEHFGDSDSKYDINTCESFEGKKPAKIMRNLCIVRTAIEHNFSRIITKQRDEHISILLMPEYVPREAILYLQEERVIGPSSTSDPQSLMRDVNKAINERIHNCRNCFPDWVNWNYIRPIFIMPNGLTEEGMKEAADKFYSSYNSYPFHIWINWDFYEGEDLGNILYSDSKFVPLLYMRNNDEFREMSRISDISDATRENVYDFIAKAGKLIALVDCENSDPYSLCATINGMDPIIRSKISKVFLFDDVHAASAWKHLRHYVDIPIEHKVIRRIKEQKSLVDMTLAVQACRECFTNGVDSILLISSDSDYWALISELPETRFLVLVEHTKVGPDLRAKLSENKYHYAYLDSFYSGKSASIKTGVLAAEIREMLTIDLNVKDIMKQAVKNGRMDLSESEERAFYDKYLRSIKLEIGDNGDLSIVMKQG